MEISYPVDVNVLNKISEKEIAFGPRINNLQLVYPTYRFNFLSIIVGALGAVPKCLVENIENIGPTSHQARILVRKLQVVSYKIFMKFS